MDLPIILAGPILRRVDAHRVTVWIATSQPFDMDAKLFKMHDEAEQLEIQCMTEFICLGERLYVYLLTLLPLHKDFPVDTLLGYNLYFKGKSTRMDLGSFGLLNPDNDQSIVYGDLKYPTFYIQKELDARFLYGSCRKLHGKRDDALAAGDLTLQETYLDLAKRPNALFLLGDQIYADDVAAPLFPILTSLNKLLMGHDEQLVKLDPRLKEKPFQRSLNQINGRQYIMEQFCQFTSSHAHNHLMKFGEYAAMYLLSWGPALWEAIQEQGGLPTFEEQIENEKFYFVFPNSKQFQKEHAAEWIKVRNQYNEDSENLRQALTTLPGIRRLLANIPTYMIFDDHDVTDDWNLSIDWKEKVGHSLLGRHVVTNAITAYWAFQGWGNCPDSFGQIFKSHMKNYFSEFTLESSSYEQWMKCIENFKSWYFVAPTEPKTLFLDTRTQREFDIHPLPVKIGGIIQENIRSPQLVSRQCWKEVSRVLMDSGWKSGSDLTIASPAPLYGIGLIESFLHSYVYPLRSIGFPIHQTLDFEAWKYNGKGFSEFLAKVFEWNPSTCFIVSGDVHYASSVQSTVQSKNGQTANIIQFTSSPMHNMSFFGLWGSMLKLTIWFNSMKRKKRNIIRYCDNDFRIQIEESAHACPTDHIWKETLRYLATDTGSIITTENNLGLLSISKDSIQNRLLSYRDSEKQELTFEL
ncbi:hypothetical protein M9R32_11780 [Paenisporosarcina quisquiliarum]|uniref:PhoD-like phosphatase n=1 Tax=Paenisporosarcina quisquiliarum TaxID=365346 RepID=A0A9X3LJX0_9BACL|nr:hypothetical protein [Paenisporosarcina quisquiliarum]MCZ8537864.1 hypothetical protein [Paenisporosarcina quisquiliarum]